MKKLFGMLVIGLIGFPGTPFALDITKPVLCAVQTVSECVKGEQCQNKLPETIDLPSFVRVDVQKGTIETRRPGDDNRKPDVGRVVKSGDLVSLNGIEDGLTWSLSISLKTEKFSATVSDPGMAFVVFGACT